MFKGILVGLDGSSLATKVLPYVTALAKQSQAEVTLLWVGQLPDDVRDGEHRRLLRNFIDQMEMQARGHLVQVEQSLKAAGVQTKIITTFGDPAAEILGIADRGEFDLIALATHGRSGFARLGYGSVAEAVVHKARMPVLLIRPLDSYGPAGPRIPQEIVVPLDGSAVSGAVLPLATQLARSLQARMTLIRVVETLYLFADPGPDSASEYQTALNALQEDADYYLNGIAGTIRSEGLTVKTVAPFGLPAPDIVDYASGHPGSLVVIGTHGRGGLGGLLLGSVARSVVQRSGTPILVVRTASAPAANEH